MSQGLQPNQVGALELNNIPVMERAVGADDKIMMDNEQNSKGWGDKIAFFIEELQQNKSFKELAPTPWQFLSDETLWNLILALVSQPILGEVNLYFRHNWLDQSTGALCMLLCLGSCMLLELSFGSWLSSPWKINVGGLAEAIVWDGCLEYLDYLTNG